ncbi:MAG TPA: PEP-CTERM sorting domain-containing protein [Candidatus Acidoferrum sp.]|jgi:hypothetical protein|nr:PEP-CTERM sorting domain-containing protein [Candidatus Acidoferrum sp.]
MKTILVVVVQLMILTDTWSQDFVNLNFELGYGAGESIPGWTAYKDNTSTTVLLNNISLSGGAVCLLGADFGTIEGNYYAYLQGSGVNAGSETAGIGQTGTIPSGVQSLIFWGNVGMNDVSFNEQSLSLMLLGSTPNYNIYGTDISAYAGKTGQLLFTSYSAQVGGQWDSVDNIQFSSSPVPEPNTVGLFALGGLFISWWQWKIKVKVP